MIKQSIDMAGNLGMSWFVSRIVYDLKLKSGWIKIKAPVTDWALNFPTIKGCFFNPNFPCLPDDTGIINKADEIINGKFPYFSYFSQQLGFPPSWHFNPFDKLPKKTDNYQKNINSQHWSKIPDFTFGDIKGIWEIARFSWIYPLIHAYQSTKDERYAKAVWYLISDWSEKNLPNSGVHWKCGQEISIRMFAIITALFSLINSYSTGPKEKQLAEKIVHESAKRVEANIGYALSQKNNHGISEAAGLFTSGILFKDANWIQKGRRILELQAKELIYDDGSFSQHSTNYHRLMLHVFLWSIQIGRANGVEFSIEAIKKIRSAGQWLLGIYDPVSGKAPNLGSNDGALIFPIEESNYLDYRPTIQAVGTVIDGKQWLDSGPWDVLANWFEPDIRFENNKNRLPSQRSFFQYFSDGGYAVWQKNTTKVLFRCPKNFKHRPAQCDLLHIDVFHGGINLLRDGGTYSYNCEKPWQSYFKSAAAHNTVQFDDHDQMPQISRFLYGKWPKLEIKYDPKVKTPKFEAQYVDWKGCRHKRIVEFNNNIIRVIDKIDSFKEKAILRWRLAPEIQWSLKNNQLIGSGCKLQINVDKGLNALKVIEGWESLYYMDKTPLPVFEITVSPECSKIITEIKVI